MSTTNMTSAPLPHASPSPYRGAAAAAITARFGYWPRVGIWPMLLAVAIGLPLAWLARRESRAASTVTCSTVAATEYAAPCLVHDARTFGPQERIACQDTPAALESFLDTRNPFSRPFVTGTVVDLPPLGAGVVAASRTTGADENGHAYPFALYKKPLASSAPPPQFTAVATDSAGGISAEDARIVLASCVAQAGTTGPGRTIALAVFERDYRLSALLLGASLLLAMVWMAGRRVRVSADAAGMIDIVEHGLVLTRRHASVAVCEVQRVVVASGASGPLHGSRVEIVRRDGASVPLSDAFAPLTSRAHTRAAARLLAVLPPRA
jgi:hypothetical protein